eukprot:1243863-Rhodomonas_salina.1
MVCADPNAIDGTARAVETCPMLKRRATGTTAATDAARVLLPVPGVPHISRFGILRRTCVRFDCGCCAVPAAGPACLAASASTLFARPPLSCSSLSSRSSFAFLHTPQVPLRIDACVGLGPRSGTQIPGNELLKSQSTDADRRALKRNVRVGLLQT